jgi:hypothetical protein
MLSSSTPTGLRVSGQRAALRRRCSLPGSAKAAAGATWLRCATAARSAAEARNSLWRAGGRVKQGHPPAPLATGASWTRLGREANIQAE